MFMIGVMLLPVIIGVGATLADNRN